MTFTHDWSSDETCLKCKQPIKSDAYFYDDDPSYKIVLCDCCYSVLAGDIERCVLDFVGLYKPQETIITHDKAAEYLVKQPL